ncbi:MAG TPA: acyl carrier protein [Actinomycetota bacterium]
MTDANVNTRLKQFIASEIMFEDDASALQDDTLLLGKVMDSLGLMQLVSFIEEEFDVTIEDSEVTVENFRTIADIEKLVDSKVKAG